MSTSADAPDAPVDADDPPPDVHEDADPNNFPDNVLSEQDVVHNEPHAVKKVYHAIVQQEGKLSAGNHERFSSSITRSSCSKKVSDSPTFSLLLHDGSPARKSI